MTCGKQGTSSVSRVHVLGPPTIVLCSNDTTLSQTAWVIFFSFESGLSFQSFQMLLLTTHSNRRLKKWRRNCVRYVPTDRLFSQSRCACMWRLFVVSVCSCCCNFGSSIMSECGARRHTRQTFRVLFSLRQVVAVGCEPERKQVSPYWCPYSQQCQHGCVFLLRLSVAVVFSWLAISGRVWT